MKVEIQSKNGTSYPVILKENSYSFLPTITASYRQVFLVYDTCVPFSFVQQILQLYPTLVLYSFSSKEEKKSIKEYQKILAWLMNHRATKQDVLLALGGGVTTDLVGFVASTYKRGIPWIALPSTILGAVDASIGGKVALNFAGCKNMIGAFYPPLAVLIEPKTFASLPQRQLQNGFVEILKVGLLQDVTILEELEKENPSLLEVLYHSILVKKYYVEKDEFDQGERQKLNFGHTLGHALELSYLDVLHGEAVAYGMLCMMENDTVLQRLLRLYQKLGIHPFFPKRHDFIRKCLQDKKRTTEQISFLVLKDYGQIETIEMDEKTCKEYVKRKEKKIWALG